MLGQGLVLYLVLYKGAVNAIILRNIIYHVCYNSMDDPELKTGQKDAPVSQKHESPAVAAAFLSRLRTNKTPWFVVVLTVCGFFLAAALFAFFSGSKKPPVVPKAQTAHAPVVSLPVQAPVVEASMFQGSPAESTTPLPLPTLSLSGILYSGTESLALINGKVVPEGGTVDGAKIEKINSDEVELSFEGQKIVLRSR